MSRVIRMAVYPYNLSFKTFTKSLMYTLTFPLRTGFHAISFER